MKEKLKIKDQISFKLNGKPYDPSIPALLQSAKKDEEKPPLPNSKKKPVLVRPADKPTTE